MLGIIGAMKEEINLIESHIKDLKIITVDKIDFYTGTLNNKDIVLCQSGIGKVQSAHATTLLIHIFKVTAIIFTGVAGAIKSSLNINDLVIGSNFLYHDFDATALGYKMTEIPDNSCSLFPSNSIISNAIIKITKSLFGEETVYQGTIISGDQFIASYDKIKVFDDIYNAYAVDMESAAVAHIAYKSNIPCCIIRSISDKANGEAATIYSDFFKDAAKKAASLLLEFTKLEDYNTLVNQITE